MRNGTQDYFVDGLRYEHWNIEFASDWISGRLVMTDLSHEKGGKVTVTTTNRGRGADRWFMHLQGRNISRQLRRTNSS
jgi:hypothetical protein